MLGKGRRKAIPTAHFAGLQTITVNSPMDYTFTKAERLNSKLTIDKLFAGGNASTVAFPLRIVYMRMPLENSSEDVVEDTEDEANVAAVATIATTVDTTTVAAATTAAVPAMPPASVLISVPKKRFRHATDRNRMKRLVREAYRQNKHILWNALKGKDYRLAIAFVCITDQLPTFRTVSKSMVKALTQISERQGK